MLRRSLKGAMFGAAITFGIGVVLLIPVFLLSSMGIGNMCFPEGPFNALLKAIPKVALISAAIGIQAGIAAKLPRHGVRMLPSIGIVACFASISSGLLLNIIYPPLKGTPVPPFLLPFALITVTAFIGSMFVLVCGLIITKRATRRNEATGRPVG